ncbi:MAG: uroporphyrinogen-III synthase [Colwellia sp.]|nr:uroporphyrinogen-III synthase [Colwellia sp.]
MTSINLKVLITRPEKSGRVLAESLSSIGISSICQPMFDFQKSNNFQHIQSLLESLKQPILIFVSTAAAEFANQISPLAQWPQTKIIAVGEATTKILYNFGLQASYPQQQDSEGILSLPELRKVTNQDIVIVRGDGGRELLAETLQQRGAHIHYIESYQRIWRTLDKKISQQWRVQQINCIVITSNALLESVVHLLDKSDNYWQSSCLWIVASKRIADHAKKLKLQNVVNANGANEQAITAALVNYGMNS